MWCSENVAFTLACLTPSPLILMEIRQRGEKCVWMHHEIKKQKVRVVFPFVPFFYSLQLFSR